jgi:hypothetical protein
MGHNKNRQISNFHQIPTATNNRFIPLLMHFNRVGDQMTRIYFKQVTMYRDKHITDQCLGETCAFQTTLKLNNLRRCD